MNLGFMNDLQRIYALLDSLEEQATERDYPVLWEKVHAAGSAQIGRMLAEKRRGDKELAALSCALHDIGRWVSGRQAEHAQNGEDPARRFLIEGKVAEETREQIVRAVINHSDKEQIGTLLEEIVKDADILDCYWHGEKITKPFHRVRLQKALLELGIGSLKEVK